MNAREQTAVDRLYQEASEIVQLFQRSGETSLQNSASDNLRKSLLLAAASHFEHRICTLVVDFVRERSSGSLLVEAFVRNKAISRQYHTMFDWEKKGANKFFGLFGNEFRTAMVEKMKDEEFAESVKAFMEIGSERNRLVHLDYATFPLEKTLDEIFALYESALAFIDYLPKALRDCDGICGSRDKRNEE